MVLAERVVNRLRRSISLGAEMPNGAAGINNRKFTGKIQDRCRRLEQLPMISRQASLLAFAMPVLKLLPYADLLRLRSSR